MGEYYQIFDAKELELLSCKCPKCGTTITFSVLTEEKFGIPAGCPTCSERMDALAGALRDCRAFYWEASKIGVRLHTRPTAQEQRP
jgi:ribosomal protein S27AE